MEVPQSVMTSELEIMGVTLIVHVLDNGQRIIEADGIHALFEAMAGDTPMTEDEGMKLARVLRS